MEPPLPDLTPPSFWELNQASDGAEEGGGVGPGGVSAPESVRLILVVDCGWLLIIPSAHSPSSCT